MFVCFSSLFSVICLVINIARSSWVSILHSPFGFVYILLDCIKLTMWKSSFSAENLHTPGSILEIYISFKLLKYVLKCLHQSRKVRSRVFVFYGLRFCIFPWYSYCILEMFHQCGIFVCFFILWLVLKYLCFIAYITIHYVSFIYNLIFICNVFWSTNTTILLFLLV